MDDFKYVKLTKSQESVSSNYASADTIHVILFTRFWNNNLTIIFNNLTFNNNYKFVQVGQPLLRLFIVAIVFSHLVSELTLTRLVNI